MAATKSFARGFVRYLSNGAFTNNVKKVSVLKPALVNRCVPSITSIRNISEKQYAEEEAKQMSWTQWLYDPFMKRVNPTEKIATPGELDDREELLARVQACYYKKPPTEPGKELFEEAFNLLIKYDDWRAVEVLWRLGEVGQHEFDDTLIDKVEDYLLEVRQRRWYEES